MLSSLWDGGASDELNYANFISITAIVPLPLGLTRRFKRLTTLLLCNIIPAQRPLRSLYNLTTLSITSNLRPPMDARFEYRTSDFFELLLCTPRFLHLRHSGIGPSIYDVTPEWVVPLGFLETLHLHHCWLQVKILRHLAISLDIKELSIHTHVQPEPHDVEAMFHVTHRRWRFIPFHVDFYQEGRDGCRLLFVGACFQKRSRDLAEFPVFTLELSFSNTALRPITVFSQYVKSFQPLSKTNIQELVINSYQWPRGWTSDPVYDLLQLLPALWKLVLKGCNESPFYEALSRFRVEGRRGKRGLIACPRLTVVEISPIVGFRKCLGGQAARCPRLVMDLSALVQTRKVCGAPLKRLTIVFPAQYQKEARYVEERVTFGPGMRAVRVRVA